MKNLRVHSRRLLGLLASSPLGHDPISLNSTAAILQSRACSSSVISTPHTQRSRKMNDGEFFDEVNTDETSERRPSTIEDFNILTVLLKEIIDQKSNHPRGSIADSKIKALCGMYKHMIKPHQYDFIRTLAVDYAVDHKSVARSATAVTQCEESNPAKLVKTEDALRNALSPLYAWLFKHIGRLENGVKFLVDFRTDIVNCIAETETDSSDIVPLQQLNVSLRDLLALWFSVGFLQLERVTWRSPCELLQKISEYEAVHPVRSWTDIKRRVGPYRRCFVFLHNSMPGEPLVVLHTALCDEIPASLAGIVSARSRMSADLTGQQTLSDQQAEDMRNIKSAIFYSITSTQRGLHGIELGNYLIKRVVRELQVEFPQMTQFATLSPIPGFKLWLLERIKCAERAKEPSIQHYRYFHRLEVGNNAAASTLRNIKGSSKLLKERDPKDKDKTFVLRITSDGSSALNPVITSSMGKCNRVYKRGKYFGGKEELLKPEEKDELQGVIEGDFWPELRKVIKSNSWLDSGPLSSALSGPLQRLCARYLYLEKRRGFALCGVGNFHMSNGAVLWRINWRADVSLRGMTNSCGMMVNYRYFLEDTEFNSQQYLTSQIIAVSKHIMELLPSCGGTLNLPSKM